MDLNNYRRLVLSVDVPHDSIVDIVVVRLFLFLFYSFGVCTYYDKERSYKIITYFEKQILYGFKFFRSFRFRVKYFTMF